MDYILIKGAEGIGYVLHKKMCKNINPTEKKTYLGYYFGEYSAIRDAKNITTGEVTLCLDCITQKYGRKSS